LSADEDGFFEPFNSVAIVGVGLIGGSLGQALKSRGLAREVVGIGRNPERLQRAIDLAAIDRYSTNLSHGIADCDLIVLCTTIQNIIQSIPAALSLKHSVSIVTDVGSTKSEIVAAAAGDPQFVGSHPMTGSEQAGVEAASPGLFQSATWAVTPVDTTSIAALARVEGLARAIGSNLQTLTPQAHDAIVAITSHLPHIMASALVRQAAIVRGMHSQAPSMSAGSFADATRVAASHPDIWRDVCLTNREAILTVLRTYKSQLEEVESAIEDNDGARIEMFFKTGAEAKKNWKRG
jgi:prephenate dehydrogenase